MLSLIGRLFTIMDNPDFSNSNLDLSPKREMNVALNEIVSSPEAQGKS